MPIDPSIADLDWLTKPGDAGSNLAKGAAVGAHIAQFRAQNASLAQRAQEFQQSQELQKQQLSMQLAAAPLHNALLQQDAALKSAQLEHALYDRQTIIGTQEALAGLAGAVSKAFTEATPEDTVPMFFDAVQKNPRIAENPYFQKLYQDAQTSISAKLELEKVKEANKSFTPQAVQVPSATPGEPPYTAIRTGPNSYTLPQSTVTSFTTPEGSRFEQRTGAGGAPASTANAPGTADIEKKLAENEQSFSLLNESLGLIAPENMGIQGKARELYEKAAGQLAPGTVAPTVTRARETYRKTALQLYRSLKADSQINRFEAAGLKDIADISSFEESSDTGRAKYQVLSDLTALHSVHLNHQLNKIAPDTALKQMSTEQVARAWKRGEITDAEATRWNDLHQLVK